MKKIILSLFFLTILQTVIVASEISLSTDNHILQISSDKLAKVGRNVFRKKLRKVCGFTGARFAHMHTQNEWQKLKEDGNFRVEIYKICPKTTTVLKDNWVEPLYEFSKAYASDSGKFPSC